MGLSNQGNKMQTFVTIVGGRFTIRLQDGDNNPDAVERTLEKGPNAGSVVRELQFTHLDGMIVGGEMHRGEYGTDFTLLMEDEGDSFKLQIPLESQYFGQVAKRLPNLDPTAKVLFGLGWDKEKSRNFLYIKQGESSIHMNFTKDNPNGMPPPVLKNIKGVEKWDFEDQENFLYEVAIDWLASLDGIKGQQVSPSDAYTDADAPADQEPNPIDEEIPF